MVLCRNITSYCCVAAAALLLLLAVPRRARPGPVVAAAAMLLETGLTNVFVSAYLYIIAPSLVICSV